MKHIKLFENFKDEEGVFIVVAWFKHEGEKGYRYSFLVKSEKDKAKELVIKHIKKDPDVTEVKIETCKRMSEPPGATSSKKDVTIEKLPTKNGEIIDLGGGTD
jgi:hypothetical protein